MTEYASPFHGHGHNGPCHDMKRPLHRPEDMTSEPASVQLKPMPLEAPVRVIWYEGDGGSPRGPADVKHEQTTGPAKAVMPPVIHVVPAAGDGTPLITGELDIPPVVPDACGRYALTSETVMRALAVWLREAADELDAQLDAEDERGGP